ncbi:Crp/Fnr family transcriptional regulator [Erythrobacter rubeus]|uniref:Crp/Fnr family transcriptional regulator n=1 Tax=Erythrobacter rubeus TaxID=2760803 RepID=A0ABR8KRN6_9SPHN|nr:Crp/Fnr family transcriptional regulator [Erythrobacter rubeus]MBD2843426.1 Crp/Fnr family transcriptional regulator [Erythrobacter rubeus]
MQNLLAKYGKVTPLRAEEEDAFKGLASAKRSYEAGTNLVASEIDEPDQLFIVEEGRLFASLDLPSGERAITRLYFSGDIVGTANIPFEHATQTITVNAPSVIYIFPRANLIDAFTRMPRVAAIFYTFAAMENAILNDRLVSIGRTRGRARLAALILEIETRRNLLADTADDHFRLGLTQGQIGDAIGLTEVQVSRLFRQFIGEGIVERKSGTVKILQRDRLVELGQFTDRYKDLDLDWFEDDR